MIFKALESIYNQVLAYWNPPNYIPPILSRYNILNITDLYYETVIRYNINSVTTNCITFFFERANIYKLTYMHRFTYVCNPYNWPLQSSLGSEIILNTEYSELYNLWCYKISRSYWFKVPDDLHSAQSLCTARFPTELFSFSLYDPFTFTFGIPTVKDGISQYTDNYQSNIDPLEVGNVLNLGDDKIDIQAVSQSAPVKSINPRFEEVTGNEIQNINDSLTLKTTNLKYTLDNFDLSLKTFGDTTELPFVPEFYNWFIFLSQYMLLFIFSLIFLFPSKNFKLINLNFKLINLNFNINRQILWPKKYPKLVTKVYKSWISYIFKWWRYY